MGLLDWMVAATIYHTLGHMLEVSGRLDLLIMDEYKRLLVFPIHS